MKPIHYLVAHITLNHTTLSAARVLVSLDAIQLDASPLVVGTLAGLFAIIPTLFSVAMGRLVDRIGTRTPMMVCSLLIVGGILLPFIWSDSVTPLFALALLVGGAYFAMFIVHTALGGFYGKPEDRAANFAHISLGLAAANGLGPLIAGFAADLIGFRLAFLFLALPALVALAIFLAGKLPQRGPAAVTAKAANSGNSVFDLWRDPRMRPVYVISIYLMLLWDIFMVMTPIYGAQLKLSASEIGIIMSTFSAASFVIRILLGPLSRRYTPMQLLLMSQALGAVAMVGFGLMSALPMLIIMAFAIGLGQGTGGPMVTTALYEVAPPERVSEAIGLRMSVGMSCQAILPLIAGGAASFVGVAPLFWLTGLILLAGAWMERSHWHRQSK